MPSLAADNNTAFGGDLINQKYSPLANITIVEGDKSFYQQIFNQRVTLLAQRNLFPRKLSLFTTAWPAIDRNTPPMVVISSNRAEWLKKLFDNAKARNKAAPITGYNDDDIFANGPVAWYAPLRSGRPVYIVVHHTEYIYYKQLLTGYPNVYVVGWRIPFPKKSFGPAGFGPSRFAALELVKNLGYHYAWAVDDNVVNINGFPNRPATIEALLTETIAGIGFKAATGNVKLGDLYNETVSFTTTAFDFTKQAAGLLQQVVLWNVDFLTAQNLNVSPYFVASNEDVSLTNYLQAEGHDERIIKPLEIIKMLPEADTKNTGAAQLAKIRTKFLEVLFNSEKTTQIQKGVAKAVNLETFVTSTILPNSQSPANSPLVTQSMAIEQALAIGVAQRWAPAKIFKPYTGFEGTKVERLQG